MNIPEPINDLLHLPLLNDYLWVWQSFMEKYDCHTVCEIGVSEGDNFELMIKHKPKVAVAVDPWIEDGIASHNDEGYSQEYLDKTYRSVMKKFADKPFVTILREYSFTAVKRFPDEYFDLVYIDGDHTFESCLKDIEDWYPKVKKGRFLIGDDYWDRKSVTGVKFGVIEAVKTFTIANNLRRFKIPPIGWAIIKAYK